MGDSLIVLLLEDGCEDATNRSHIYNCYENKSVSPIKLGVEFFSFWLLRFNFPRSLLEKEHVFWDTCVFYCYIESNTKHKKRFKDILKELSEMATG